MYKYCREKWFLVDGERSVCLCMRRWEIGACVMRGAEVGLARWISEWLMQWGGKLAFGGRSGDCSVCVGVF